MYDLNDNNSGAPVQPQGMWETWSRGRILGLTILLAASNFIFQGIFYSLNQDLFMPVLAAAIAGVLLPVIWIAQNQGFTLRRDFSLFMPHPLILVAAALMAVAGLVPTSLLAELSARLFPVDQQWLSFFSDKMPESNDEILVAVIAVVVVGPLVEEIIFRGLLQRLVTLRLGPMRGMLISAVVFGAIHMEPWYIFGLIGVGLMLAFIFHATGSVTACWVAHAVHNAVSLWVMLGSEELVVETQAITTSDWLLGAGSVVGILVVGKFLLTVGKRTT